MEIGNVYYYLLFLFILTNITILSVFIVNKKSVKFNKIFIFSILLSGFILHFLKLLFPPYHHDWPYSLSSISFENLCAVSTLIFPWLYLSKNQFLKDYMVLVGLISGLVSIIFPYQSAGFERISFDIIRFYYAHFVLFLAPLLMLHTNLHHFNLKSIFKIPFLVYGSLILILANEVILITLGIVSGDINTLLDPSIRNSALIFGPNPYTSGLNWLYSPLVPDVLKTIPYGENAGQPMYWPIIWMIIPVYLFVCLIGVIIDLSFKYASNKIESKPFLISDEIYNYHYKNS